MVKNSSQISRSAPNIENFGSGLEKRKEVFCSIGMLGDVGQSMTYGTWLRRNTYTDHVWGTDCSAMPNNPVKQLNGPRISDRVKKDATEENPHMHCSC